MHNNTIAEFEQVTTACRDIFNKKTLDYGTAWRVLRPSSITDQLFIKAKRIRSIEEKGMQMIGDSIADEYRGLINYCIIALIQLELVPNESTPLELPAQEVIDAYTRHLAINKTLLQQKNHDYGEAWRDMRISSLTDLILMKILRIKQIEDNGGKTLISEGTEGSYRDIINYAAFALIKLLS